MRKRIYAALLTGTMVMSLLAGCGTTEGTTAASPEKQTEVSVAGSNGGSGKQIKVAISLANAADYYIGTMVGASVQGAFEEAGATTQILDAGIDVSNQLNQIENAITSGVDIIYIFPSGDGPTYYDVLQTARAVGVKTLMSNNYAGEGGADAYVGNDEFQMGVMMAAMVSEWVEETYPNAGAGEVGVLAVEATMNKNATRRCLGMRMIAEKFLRKGDMASARFKIEAGDPVTYLDADGKEIPVDEPTGGLLLDANGHAQLNPYYNEKVKIIEYSNRNKAGTDAVESQTAVENAITLGESDLKAVISYGDTGAAIETKVRELCQEGRITTELDKIAVFCSDLTDTNRKLILSSGDNTSVLRGTMASGNLIATLQEYAKAMVAGKEVPEYTMEPISYMKLNATGDDIETVYYTDCPPLPDTETFFTD